MFIQVDKRRWGWAGQDTGHKPSTQSAGRIQQVGYHYQDGYTGLDTIMMTDTLAWILYKDGYNRLDIIMRTDITGWILL